MMSIKHKNILSIACVAILGMMVGCIENDIPYPRIPAQIIAIEVAGTVQAPVIDNEARTVALVMADTVNLKRVNIKSATLTEEAVATPSIVGVHDLSSPAEFTLSIYQDYTWTISATQHIERKFVVAGQVGMANIEVDNKRARVYVNERVDLANVDIETLQLGPAGITTYNPPLSQLKDFSKGPRHVTVMYHDEVEEWTLYVVPTQSNVTLTSVDAWTRVAWLYGNGLEQNDNRFEIRESSATEWTTVPEEYMVARGSSFSARMIHLKPNTEYVARAVIPGETSNEITFTTDGESVLPNGGFDDWWKDGSVWNPWSEGGTSWWDTGNRGAATLGESNSVPTDDAVKGKAAMLQTRFVGIAGLGKLAAGNIFAGEFGAVDGTNGIIYLGEEFVLRPTKLKGYYKYTNGAIDYADNTYKDLLGQPDCMSIYIALGDWDEPVEIRTNPKNRKLFDVNDPHIIAYKAIESTEPTDGYVPFELELDYRSTSRVPKYMIIIASGSRLGDFFTGSTQSVLCVDEFSLEWDY